MKKDNIISFPKKMKNNCILTEVLREGADRLLNKVMNVELEYFLLQYRNVLDNWGRPSVVRNGYLPQRKIHTGIGEILIRVPRVRDRNRTGINFKSKVIPGYLKRTNELTELFPWYYLQGKLSGNLFEALRLLAGSNTSCFPESMCVRLKNIWKEELAVWETRSFSSEKYSHYWIEVINPPAKLEKSSQHILVIIGADENNNKELLDFQIDSFYDYQPWKKVLTNLSRRGLEIDRNLIIGNPSLSFWKAWHEVYRGGLSEGDKFCNMANS